MIQIQCPACSKSFNIRLHIANDGKRHFCSVACKRANAPRTDAVGRFWSYVNKTDTCWLWTRSQNGKGYGQFFDGKQRIYAHRFSWEIHFGKIPEGKLVCHRCDVRHCVRPDHFFLGTYLDNSRDAVQKGRHSHGETQWKSTVSEATVMEIRRLYAARTKAYGSVASIARKLNLTRSTVVQIALGYTWKHLPLEGESPTPDLFGG